ncbi:MAG: mucin desulfatase, partial [Oscillospiraceae bacterium]
NDTLTDREVELLPMSAKLMTLECGMRFLTDYLEGDTYFKTHRDGQNLDRTRTQFKIVADMESKMQDMANIIKEIRKK